jgi:hypothetical protein
MGVLVSQGQSETSYDPVGRLDFETTYYWRVDEVNAAPDNTIFKGEVWSFTSEPFAYAIADVIATSNGVSEEGAGPENTVNGSGLNAGDQHSTASTDMWLAAGGAEPLWIQYEFDRVYQLHQMLVWNYNVQFELMLGFGVKGATVEYSVDGAEWTALGDVELAQATAKTTYTHNTTVDFGGVPVKYVRLTVRSGFGMMGQFGLSEVRFMFVPSHARQPEPADGATDVDPDMALGWRAGRQAASHEVYLGTDPAVLSLAGTVGANSFTADDLMYAGTYYWRVDEVNEAEAVSRWEGDVWSFAAAAYGVVDDMESYTDDTDAGEAIFQTWIDGWENGTGGAGRVFRCAVRRADHRARAVHSPCLWKTTTPRRRITPRPCGPSILRRTGRPWRAESGPVFPWDGRQRRPVVCEDQTGPRWSMTAMPPISVGRCGSVEHRFCRPWAAT